MRLWPRRASARAALVLSALAAVYLWTFADAARLRNRASSAPAQWAARLGLTDLCLFPEARYTRHPSQADLHSPFQDHPAARDHFPAAAFLPPPPHLRRPR
jgi:hypothetical protein